MVNKECKHSFVYQNIHSFKIAIACRKHHTVSHILMYGLREALAEICEQSLESFRDRHYENSLRLQKGLQNMGLELFVEKPEERLPTITAVRIPYGVNWSKVSDYLLDR